MKNVKIYFSALAFVIAIGGVYASTLFAVVPGYYSIGQARIGVLPQECFNLEDCSTTGTAACATTTTHTVNGNSIAVGTPLKISNGTVCTVSAFKVQ